MMFPLFINNNDFDIQLKEEVKLKMIYFKLSL